jgi:hypothetical protein
MLGVWHLGGLGLAHTYHQSNKVYQITKKIPNALLNPYQYIKNRAGRLRASNYHSITPTTVTSGQSLECPLNHERQLDTAAI